MRALNPHGPLIERVNRTFLDRVSGEYRTPGMIFLPVFAVTASEDAWVSVLSSGLNIESSNRKVVRGAHTKIVKPASKDDDTYQWVLTRMRDLSTDRPAPFDSNFKDATVKIINDDSKIEVPSFSRPYVYKESEWLALLGKVVFGRYLLRTLVGYGGTGAVFRSRESSMGRDVAVKIFYSIPTEFMETLSNVTARSVRALASLSHDNIQRILDYGVFANASSGASLFIVSEFIEGTSLFQLLSKECRDATETSSLTGKILLARQVAAGLHCGAHLQFCWDERFRRTRYMPRGSNPQQHSD